MVCNFHHQVSDTQQEILSELVGILLTCIMHAKSVLSLMLIVTKGPISVFYCKSDIVTLLFQNICPAGQCSHSASCDVGRFGAIRVLYGCGCSCKIGIGKEHC